MKAKAQPFFTSHPSLTLIVSLLPSVLLSFALTPSFGPVS